MFDLLQYQDTVIAMSEANNVTEDIGLEMFIANLDKGEPVEGQPWYAGAEDFDFGELSPEWNALTREEQGAAIEAYTAAI